MIHAYNESYLNDAKQNLADSFYYAIDTYGFSPEFFSKLFVISGYAEQFERGDPTVIAGISGTELARKVIRHVFPDCELPEEEHSKEKTDAYWAGWVLAEYQWRTYKRFKEIFLRIPLLEILLMYDTYHEMDIKYFIEEMERRYYAIERETKLKIIRENRGLSQSELAKLSGVKLRSIQMYEQRGNDIDRAQAQTLYKISRVLGCSIEDLLENPEL